MKAIYHSPDGDQEAEVTAYDKDDGTVSLKREGRKPLDGVKVTTGDPVIGGATIEAGEVEVVSITEGETEKELSKEEIKAKLDELGVEYDARLGIEKLREILESNI